MTREASSHEPQILRLKQTNGLLPKNFSIGTDLNAYGTQDLEHVTQEPNGRPRKTLD